MRRSFSLLHAIALVSLGAATADAQFALQITRVASGLDRPIAATAPPGDLDRLFIAEQHSGRIVILDRSSTTLLPTPFLTIAGLSTGNEQGLLGLAFDPDYASNGHFFVNLTVADGDTEIRRYTVSGDPNVADAGSAATVLSFSQPQGNHNGGWIEFGPDGFLYIGSGDGGASNDEGTGHTEPGGNSQDLSANLLGKLLRIDVDGDDFPGDPLRNYAIPASNPFVGITGDDEIWAYGLRNPWRAGFDRLTGDLYVGDVGQGAFEEIDFQPAASLGGENYGWRLREGMIATPASVGGPAPIGAINPMYAYAHGDGITEGYSVTGGYVYRGPIVDLQGYYFFADYVSQRIWMLQFDGSTPASFDGTNFTTLLDATSAMVVDAGAVGSVASFGEDSAGNLFIIDHDGEVFLIAGLINSFGSTDAFKLYKTRRGDGAAKFYGFGPIVLADDLATGNYNLVKPLSLGSPAAINGDAVIDTGTHLVEYKIKALQTRDESTLNVINGCDALTLRVSKPVSLLVPTNVATMVDPAVPNPAAHDVDHFTCFKARATVRLPRGSQLEVADNFDGGLTRRYDLGSITKLCVPTAKSGSPNWLRGPQAGSPKPISPASIESPGEYTLCYRAKLARSTIAQSGCGPVVLGDLGTPISPSQAKHTPALALHTNNQFGLGLVDTAKETEICLPTVPLP